VIRLTTGLPGASFNPLGTGLARAYSRAYPEVAFKVVPSRGSIDNLDALQRGTAELGLAFTDVAYLAFVGQGHRRTERTSYERLRGIAVLQLTPLQVMVRPHSSVTAVHQLRGGRLALGPSGSGTALTAELILRSFGLTRNHIHAVSLPFMEAAEQLVDGELDGAFVSAGYPADSVHYAATAGARLIDVTGPVVDTLRAEYPFLRVARIPGGTYPSHDTPIRTVGVDTMLACREDLDEMLVYRLTKTLFEALPGLAARLDSLKSMDLDQVAATPIPLHSGAARYYRERELSR
jgi:TRAP transporter TAXI family solute receptor